MRGRISIFYAPMMIKGSKIENFFTPKRPLKSVLPLQCNPKRKRDAA